MTSGGGSGSSQNLVTPGDVGRRVSFLYEHPNGFRTELVGMLESFDEAADAYVVRAKDGELVNVPRIDVRFGKVVPS